jgi:hypothetical protein
MGTSRRTPAQTIAPQLGFSWGSAENLGTEYEINLTVTNTGNVGAPAVSILAAPCGTTSTIPYGKPPLSPTLPISVGDVGAGQSVTITLYYPSTVGAPGTKVGIGVAGQYIAEGLAYFSFSSTVTLPAVIPVKSVSFPANVIAGLSTTGTVTLGLPPPRDVNLILSTSNSAAVIPPSVTVRARTTTATFHVGTLSSNSTTTAVVKAAYAGVAATGTLTILGDQQVQPPPQGSVIVGIANVSGNGYSDLITLNPSDQLVVFFSNYFATIIGSATVTNNGVPVTVPADTGIAVTSNLNGNGRAAIVLRLVDGTVEFMELDSEARVINIAILIYQGNAVLVPPTWSVLSSDLNANGQNQLLLYQPGIGNGQVSFWDLNGSNWVGGSPLLYDSAQVLIASPWRLLFGLTNSGGQPELFAINDGTGEITISFLNQTTWISGAELTYLGAPVLVPDSSGWEIVGSGFLEPSSGLIDIAFHNPVSGETNLCRLSNDGTNWSSAASFLNLDGSFLIIK